MRKKIITILFALLLIAPSALALSVPNAIGYVNDFANVIDDKVERQLEQTILDYEKQTSNEITLVTIASLDGESIESFTMRLAEDWKVGKADKDNGIILLFAIEEKRVRLEVGYGLEGVINDAKAGRLLDNYVVEHRDKGDYTNASKNGIEGIIENLGEESWNEDMQGEEISLLILFLIIFVLMVAIIAFGRVSDGNSYYSGSSNSGSAGSGGSSSGGFGGGSFGGGGASR